MSRNDWITRPIEFTETTTVWRDGEVLRKDWRGRITVLKRIEPLPEEVNELDAEVVL